jgi:glycosyltransferase involved in cell wall biosynthesis
MIDIIIPAYNAHKLIDRALLSIANQSIKDKLNVYIINDNSNKNYSEFLKKYYEYFNITEMVLKENHGPGYARQYGIEHSKSEYIAFLDSDDMFYSSLSLEFLYNKAIETGCDLVYSNIYDQIDNNYKLLEQDFIDVQGKLYKRKYIEEHNVTFPPFYGEEDNSFNQQFYSYNFTYEKVDSITYVRCDNKESLTRSNNNVYMSKYESYFSNGYLYTIDAVIKNSGSKERIASLIYTPIVKLYYSIVVKNNNNHDEVVLTNLKKLISLYKEYLPFLSDQNKKSILDYELYCVVSEKEIENLISIDDFIEQYK